MRFCPECGKEIKDTMRFCINCGADLGMLPAFPLKTLSVGVYVNGGISVGKGWNSLADINITKRRETFCLSHEKLTLIVTNTYANTYHIQRVRKGGINITFVPTICRLRPLDDRTMNNTIRLSRDVCSFVRSDFLGGSPII